MFDLSTLEIVAVLAAVMVGAIVQGSAGVGLGLVASPIALSIDPDFAPGPLLFAGLVVGGRHIVAEWPELDRPTFKRAAAGLPIGAIAAVAVLELLDPRLLGLLIGLLICATSVALLAGMRLDRSPATDVLTGAASAFTSLAAALPGPPLAIGFHDLAPRAMRCTISLFVAAISAVAIVSLTAIGRLGTKELGLFVLTMPAVGIGIGVSRWTRPWLDRDWFRPSVLLLSFAGGAALVLQRL